MSRSPSLPSQIPFSPRWCIRGLVGAIAAAAMFASVGLLSLTSAAASSAAPKVALAQSSDVAASAADQAQGKIGTPYSWGGNGPDAFDCSGLVHWSYAQAGVSLPRTTQSQVGSGSAVARDDLQLGDLLFFYSGNSHVGIYAGENTMVHAPSSGSSVRVDSLSGYWDNVFSTARRVA